MKRFAIACLLSVCMSAAWAETLIVRPGGAKCWNGIQDAVNRAKPGDIVLVHDGLYVERVVIETSGVTLMGYDKKRVSISFETDGSKISCGICPLRVLAPDVTIANIQVDNPRRGNFSPCIIGHQCDGLRLVNVDVCAGNKDSVFLIDASNVQVVNCRIRSTLDALSMESCDGFLVRGCTFDLRGGDGALWCHNSSGTVMNSQLCYGRSGGASFVNLSGEYNCLSLEQIEMGRSDYVCRRAAGHGRSELTLKNINVAGITAPTYDNGTLQVLTVE